MQSFCWVRTKNSLRFHHPSNRSLSSSHLQLLHRHGSTMVRSFRSWKNNITTTTSTSISTPPPLISAAAAKRTIAATTTLPAIRYNVRSFQLSSLRRRISNTNSRRQSSFQNWNTKSTATATTTMTKMNLKGAGVVVAVVATCGGYQYYCSNEDPNNATTTHRDNDIQENHHKSDRCTNVTLCCSSTTDHPTTKDEDHPNDQDDATSTTTDTSSSPTTTANDDEAEELHSQNDSSSTADSPSAVHNNNNNDDDDIVVEPTPVGMMVEVHPEQRLLLLVLEQLPQFLQEIMYHRIPSFLTEQVWYPFCQVSSSILNVIPSSFQQLMMMFMAGKDQDSPGIVPSPTSSSSPQQQQQQQHYRSVWYRTYRMILRCVQLMITFTPMMAMYPLYRGCLYIVQQQDDQRHSTTRDAQDIVLGMQYDDNDDDNTDHQNNHTYIYGTTRRMMEWYYQLCLYCVEHSGGATIIKLMQWVSTRPDLFGYEFCTILQPLQDHTTPHSIHHTEQMLCEAYGPDWYRFLQLGPIIGSGCIGQVYRGTIQTATTTTTNVHTNEENDPSNYTALTTTTITTTAQQQQQQSSTQEVAIKVLHPNVLRDIDTDLDILRCIVRMIPYLPLTDNMYQQCKWLNLDGIMEEFAKLLKLQMDLRYEAQNLQKFQSNFRQDPVIQFPELIQHENLPPTSNVLIESFCEGTSIGYRIYILYLYG
jgi:hypothetical protein